MYRLQLIKQKGSIKNLFSAFVCMNGKQGKQVERMSVFYIKTYSDHHSSYIWEIQNKNVEGMKKMILSQVN